MAMTQEEKLRFSQLQEKVADMDEQLETNKSNITELTNKLDTILSTLKSLAWGVGIGIILTLLLLGVLTVKDILGST